MNKSDGENDERVIFIQSSKRNQLPYVEQKPQGLMEDFEMTSFTDSSDELCTSLSRLVFEGGVSELRAFFDFESELELLDEKGFCALHYAAMFNQPDILMFLLDSGANINARSRTDNMTPLHIACKYESDRVVPVLLRRGADPALKANYGYTALHFAVEKGNLSIVETLLQSKCVIVNACDRRGHTPLHNACMRKRIEVCALLVKYGATVDMETNENITPFHIAAYLGNVQTLQLLVEKAADQGCNIKELLECTGSISVLTAAVTGGSPDGVKFVVEQGVSAKMSKTMKYAPLHSAAVFGEPESLRCLLCNGAEPDPRDVRMKTPLHWASALNRTKAIKILLEAGANVDAKDNMGLTPLLIAVRAGHLPAFQLLLESGADITVSDSKLRTSLHLAIERENFEMTNFLLQRSGKKLMNMVDSRERSPVHYAALCKNSEILQTLVDRGCTCLVADENLKTPLHFAAEYGKLKNVMILVQASVPLYMRRDEMGRLAVHYAAMNGRSKSMAVLLGCPQQANTVDIESWSPLLWAAKSGFVECVEMLLKNGALPGYRDAKGNTALHVAVTQGHTKVILCLLDNGVPVLNNHEGLNCLDYALENKYYEGVKAMVQHKRWREFFDTREKNLPNLLGKLIETCPSAAEAVLDNCVERSPNPRDSDYTITYNFRLLDPGPHDVSTNDGTRFFGLSELIRHRREHLIQHPVASKMLSTKWKSFGLPLYFVNSITYLCFVILLTVFVQTNRENLILQGSTPTKENNIVTSSLNSALNTAGLVFVVFQMIKEILQIYMLRMKYFLSFQNFIEWAIYTTGFLFLIATATNSEQLNATNFPLQCGTICIFLSYMNLIVQTRLVWYIGLYVTMFLEVFKTLVQVMSMVAMFIVAYAVVFIILFKEQAPFADFGKAIVKTTVMTIGELDYNDLLVTNLYASTNKTGIPSPLVPYPIISNIFFYIFMLTMPIVLMNLLVGLAVGDIEAIRKTSNLRRKAAMIDFLKETESRYPVFITQWLYKAQRVEKPNCKRFKKLNFLTLGGSWIDSFDDDQEYSFNNDLKTRCERLDKRVYKTKVQVKSISALLEKQNRMLVALTSKQNMCQGDEEETMKLL